MKGKGKEKEVVVVLVDVSPPKKRLKVEGRVFGEARKGQYIPAWDIPSSLVMGGPGILMTLFQHCFPPTLKRLVEKVPTELLNGQVYQQKFEVSVLVKLKG